MKILRFSTPDLSPRHGWLYEDMIGQIDGDPFSGYRRLDPDIPINSVRLLPPVLPGKIVCIGHNYEAHIKEMNNQVGEIPTVFLKPGTSLIGPNDPIVLPPQSEQVHHEAELAVVIGTRALDQAQRGNGVCFWLYHRQRRHCARFAAERYPMDAARALTPSVPGPLDRNGLRSGGCSDHLSCRP